MSAYLCYVWLPVPMISGYCYNMTSSYLYSMMSASLYPVWIIYLWRLAPCTYSGYLNDVYLPVLCLHSCMMCFYLCDVCLPVLCLPTCTMSAQLNNVCLAVWCLLTFIMSGDRYPWCGTSIIQYLFICMSSYLYVCLYVCENLAFFASFAKTLSFSRVLRKL